MHQPDTHPLSYVSYKLSIIQKIDSFRVQLRMCKDVSPVWHLWKDSSRKQHLVFIWRTSMEKVIKLHRVIVWTTRRIHRRMPNNQVIMSSSNRTMMHLIFRSPCNTSHYSTHGSRRTYSIQLTHPFGLLVSGPVPRQERQRFPSNYSPTLQWWLTNLHKILFTFILSISKITWDKPRESVCPRFAWFYVG